MPFPKSFTIYSTLKQVVSSSVPCSTPKLSLTRWITTLVFAHPGHSHLLIRMNTLFVTLGKQILWQTYFKMIFRRRTVQAVCQVYFTLKSKTMQKLLWLIFQDCNRVIYDHVMTIEPFRLCDEKNFGVSELCDLDLR